MARVPVRECLDTDKCLGLCCLGPSGLRANGRGICSKSTMIVNNRMIIGMLPYIQLRAIFQALVEQSGRGGEKGFIEQ